MARISMPKTGSGLGAAALLAGESMRNAMNVPRLKPLAAAAALAVLGVTALPAAGADWSDTSISWRYGTSFAEPFDNNASGGRQDIKKNIFGLTHASGFKYGTNFFN